MRQILKDSIRMSKAIKIKKGVDIKLVGAPEAKVSAAQKSNVYAIKPDDFFGTIPKLVVKKGDEVKAGSTLFYDKKRERIKFASPVSGEVVEIVRGEKRKILAVKILADAAITYAPFDTIAQDNREKLIETMLSAGLWPFVKQRPYGTIANPDEKPRSIFISGFDSAPLAADMEVVLKDQMEYFKKGLHVLKVLGDGADIHLGVKAGSAFYQSVTEVDKTEFKGPHPAGNVGVQIHHTRPVNKGEVIWTVNPADVALIGRSLQEGKFRAERTIALSGSEVKTPQYYTTLIGASIESIVGDNEKEGNNRIISGDVLTGSKVERDGFFGFYDTTITIIPEGDHKKFFLTEGWLSPGFSRFSLNHSYPSWLMKGKKYRLDTNLNGEKRAFVVTGEMEKVFPFDIYPMRLIKAIMINDIEQMENLGIYEVVPEDFALCEFACTSKINIQSVVAQGLLDLRNEFVS